VGSLLVKIANKMTRIRGTKCRPEELLVLLPSCLQNSQCRQKVTTDVQECLRCGRCKLKNVLEMCEEYGVRCAIATGGRLALKMARDESVKGLIAVACEKELKEGMFGVFPKAALGVVNLRPNGPCTDTDVDLDELREAIAWFLRD
jgi:hypothetical protein